MGLCIRDMLPTSSSALPPITRGGGAKYTRSRLPVKLVACAAFATKNEAMSAEYRFKQLTRSQKLRLLDAARESPFEIVLDEWLSDQR